MPIADFLLVLQAVINEHSMEDDAHQMKSMIGLVADFMGHDEASRTDRIHTIPVEGKSLFICDMQEEAERQLFKTLKNLQGSTATSDTKSPSAPNPPQS